MNPINDPEITQRSPENCPISSRWHHDWREYTIALTRTPEAREERTRLRQAAEGPLLRRFMVEWHTGPGDASLFAEGRTPPLTSATHEHAAFEVLGHDVHLDRISATGGGPGFSLRAVVIHVDGEFRGSGWVFGSLGGSGNSFPAFARIGDGLAVCVGFRAGPFDLGPHVELRLAPQGTGASS